MQPQIEYGLDGYRSTEAAVPCRVIIYAGSGANEIRLVPDGCEEIIFVRGRAGLSFLRPDKTKRTEITLKRSSDICGIRLEWGFTFDIPEGTAEKIAESVVRVASDSRDKAGQILPEGIMPYIRPRGNSSVWSSMAKAAVKSRGRITVKELAETFGYTERHINNIFNECAGYGPKDFCKFVRFQNVLAQMADDPRRENSQFIERLSYADQAHFQREFKSFTGMTPRQFVRKYFAGA